MANKKQFLIGVGLTVASVFGAPLLAGATSAAWIVRGVSALRAISMSMGLGLIGKSLQGARREAVDRRVQGAKMNPRSTQANVPVVYGKARIGMATVDVRVIVTGGAVTPGSDPTAIFSGADNNDVLCKVGAFCVGSENGLGIQAINNVRMYDDGVNAITTPAAFSLDASTTGVTAKYRPGGTGDGFLKYTLEAGTDAQVVRTQLDTQLGWTQGSTAVAGRGIAYGAFYCNYDEEVWDQGFPTITADVTGNRVYDPRTPAGGPNSDGYINWSATGASSDNPALCILDYLTSKRYGGAVPYAARDGGGGLDFIDETSFQQAANYCDELVSIPGMLTEKRFVLNGVVPTNRMVGANVLEMLAACRGEIVWQNGKYRLIIREVAASESFELTEDNIIGELKWTRMGTTVPNQMEATFPNNSSGEYDTDSVAWPPASSTTYITEDNGVENRAELALQYVTGKYQAQRIIMTMLKEARQDVSVSLTATQAAYTLEVGDVVDVTHEGPGWVQKSFRVREMILMPEGTVGLSLQSYDAAAYTLATLEEEEVEVATELPNPNRPYTTVSVYDDRFVSSGEVSATTGTQAWRRRLRLQIGAACRSLRVQYSLSRPTVGGGSTAIARDYNVDVTPNELLTVFLSDGAASDQQFWAQDDTGTTIYDSAFAVTITPNDEALAGGLFVGDFGLATTSDTLDLEVEDDVGIRVDAEIATKITEYTGPRDNWVSFAAGVEYIAQQFTIPSGGKDIRSVAFRLRSVGSPVGSIQCFLYSNDAAPAPDTPDASVKIGTSVQANTITAATDGEDVEFFFEEHTLAAGLWWAVLASFPQVSNYIDVGVDASTPSYGLFSEGDEFFAWTSTNTKASAAFAVTETTLQTAPARKLTTQSGLKFSWLPTDGRMALSVQADAAGGAGVGTHGLTDHTDVTLTAPVAGDFLRYSGFEWVNAVISLSDLPAIELTTLTDVNTSTATNRNVLVADGIDWESRALVAADIQSGTFADGRISQSSVTQHEGAINHDALLNYVAGQHVLHSAVSIDSGTGLTGGGDITIPRTLSLLYSTASNYVLAATGGLLAAFDGTEEMPIVDDDNVVHYTALSNLEGYWTIAAASQISGILPLANGGTGGALVDPNADRILFWDDSATATAFLEVAGGLEIPVGAPTTIQVDAGAGLQLTGGEVATDLAGLGTTVGPMVSTNRFIINFGGVDQQIAPANIPATLLDTSGLPVGFTLAGDGLVNVGGAGTTVAVEYDAAANVISQGNDLTGATIVSTDRMLVYDVTAVSSRAGFINISQLPFTNNVGTVTSVALATDSGLLLTGTVTVTPTLDLDIVSLGAAVATSPTTLDSLAFHLDGSDTKRILFGSIDLSSFNDDITGGTLTATLGVQRVVDDFRINYGGGANGLIGAAPNLATAPAAIDALLIGEGGITAATKSIQFSQIPLGIMNDLGYAQVGVDETITGAWTFPDTTDIGVTVQSYDTMAATDWDRGAGTHVFVNASTSTGQPTGGDRGYWFTMGRRDAFSGYAGLYLELGRTLWLGERDDNSTNGAPTWTEVSNVGHVHSAADITSGTLLVARGGTGRTTVPGNDEFLVSTGSGYDSSTGLTWNGTTLTATNLAGNGSGLTDIVATQLSVVDVAQNAPSVPMPVGSYQVGLFDTLAAGDVDAFGGGNELYYVTSTNTLHLPSMESSADLTVGGTLDVTGIGTFDSLLNANGNIRMTGVAPTIDMWEDLGTPPDADEGYWRFVVSGGYMYLQTRTDVNGAGVNALTFSRTSGTIVNQLEVGSRLFVNSQDSIILRATAIGATALQWDHRLQSGGNYELRSVNAGSTVVTALSVAHATGDATFVGDVRSDSLTIGASAIGYYGNRFAGTFTSDGASTAAAHLAISGTVIGAVGDTSWLSVFGSGAGMNGSVTTQSGTEDVIGAVSTLRLGAPTITNNLWDVTLGEVISTTSNGTVNTTLAHGWTGSTQKVYITGHSDANYNGWWTITVVDTDTFTLNGWTGTASGTGGNVYEAGRITRAATLYINDEPTAGKDTGIDEAWGIYTTQSARFGSVTSAGIVPVTDATYALGSATNRWNTIYGTTLDITGEFLAGDGSLTDPAYGFTDHAGSGMYYLDATATSLNFALDNGLELSLETNRWAFGGQWASNTVTSLDTLQLRNTIGSMGILGRTAVSGDFGITHAETDAAIASRILFQGSGNNVLIQGSAAATIATFSSTGLATELAGTLDVTGVITTGAGSAAAPIIAAAADPTSGLYFSSTDNLSASHDGVQIWGIDGFSLFPGGDAAKDLGVSSRRWRKLWVDDITASGTLAVTGDITAASNIYSGQTTDFMIVSGGSTASLGANMIMYGESHSSNPGDILFRDDTTTRVVIDGPTGNVTINNDLTVSGTGPHAIGGATTPATSLRILGTGAAGINRAMQIESRIKPAVNTEATLFRVVGTIDEFSSGVHPSFAAAEFVAPTITAGTATITTASTVRITGAPTAGVNNYSLWVGSGATELGGTLDVTGWITATSGIDISGAGGFLNHNNTDNRTKIRVWNSDEYGLGMGSAYTFGGLNNYSMTFQTGVSPGPNVARGWWWGTDVDGNDDGSMSLTNTGLLTVASGMRIGYGSPDTTAPTANLLDISGSLDVTGNSTFSGNMHLNNAAGNEMLLLKDTGGAGVLADPYMRFEDSGGTSQGYIGFGSTFNQDMYLSADVGRIELYGKTGVFLRHDNTAVFSTISTTAVRSYVAHHFADGTSTNPGITWTNDQNCGWYRVGSNQISQVGDGAYFQTISASTDLSLYFYQATTQRARLRWNNAAQALVFAMGTGITDRFTLDMSDGTHGLAYFSNTQVYNQEGTEITATGTQTLDWDSYNQVAITNVGVRTINIDDGSMQDGGHYCVVIDYVSGSTTDWTWTPTGTLRWQDGAEPVLSNATVGDRTVVTFIKTEGDTLGFWATATV